MRNLLVKKCEREGDIADHLPQQVANLHDVNLLASSPLFQQPGTVPYRVVILGFPGEFIVYDEYVNDHCRTTANGNYFPFDLVKTSQAKAFHKALAKFANRCQMLAVHAESLDRPEHCFEIGDAVQVDDKTDCHHDDCGVIESIDYHQHHARVRIPTPITRDDNGDVDGVGAPVVVTLNLYVLNYVRPLATV